MKEACRRHFPVGDSPLTYTAIRPAAPIVDAVEARPNIAGVIAIENSTFGFINEKKHQWGGHVGKIEGYQAWREECRILAGPVQRSLHPHLARPRALSRLGGARRKAAALMRLLG